MQKRKIIIEAVALLILTVGQFATLPDWISHIPFLREIKGYITFVLLMDLLRRISIYLYLNKHKLGSAYETNFSFGVNNIYRFLIGIGSVIFIFSLFGIDLKTLLTSLSIVAAAIVIMTKEYLNDFVYGLYFSFSKDFEINDYVQINDKKGRIQEISMLKVKLLNDDDDLVVIPNTKVFTNDIINYTKRDIRALSIDFQIDIKYVNGIESLEQDLITSLDEFASYLEPESFNLKIMSVKKDCLDLKFQYTLKDIDREVQRSIRRRTARRILSYVTEASARDAGAAEVVESTTDTVD